MCLGLVLTLLLTLAPGPALAQNAPEAKEELSVALGAAPREASAEKQQALPVEVAEAAATPRPDDSGRAAPPAPEKTESPAPQRTLETAALSGSPSGQEGQRRELSPDATRQLEKILQDVPPSKQETQRQQTGESKGGTPPAQAAQTAPAQTAPVRPVASVPAAPAAQGGGAAAGGSGIRLFGTVEFRGALKNMPKWERVLNAEKRSPTFDKDLSPVMRPAVYTQWKELTQRAGSMPIMEKLRSVNVFFNRWPYRTDREVYKVEDYWATPWEFMKNSGDCEDYAIAKFYALKKLGVNPENMRVVALIDKIRNIGHAILVVYTDNNAYILDNLTDLVLSHERFKQYAPQYSVNEVYRWAHVTPTQKR